MTAKLFRKWVEQIEGRFQRQDRKVALVIDNCPPNPNVTGLKAVELVFLPPNTRAVHRLVTKG